MADRPTGRKAGALPPAAMSPYKAVTKGGNRMEEIWRDIQGYEGLYQVSNLGNVKSLNYRHLGYAQNLVPKISNKGRMWVELAKNGEKRPLQIARLVAYAFIDNPHNCPVVNHKDENPLNNMADNLEWCTLSYNVRYSLEKHPERIEKSVKNRGKRSSGYKNPHGGCNMEMKIDQFDLNGEYIRTWKNSRTIFLETGMSDWSISECCRGNRKKAYGYKWRYAI